MGQEKLWDVVFHPFSLGLATALTVVGLGAVLSPLRSRLLAKGGSQAIKRWRPEPRACAVLEHNGVVYVSGQVANKETLPTTDITQQTKETLAKIDELLAEAGTSKEYILSSQIWVKDISVHFEPMNKVWNAWVHPENKGVRACVEAKMARPDILVEVKVIAALP